MKTFYLLLSIALFVLSGYLILTDMIVLPSRYGNSPSVIESPVTYLMAFLPFSFGCASLLSVFDLPKSKPLIQVFVTLGVLSFFAAVVFIGPLLKAIG